MIFPGMDPYLEDSQRWPGVHTAFIVYLRDQLQPMLRPRYWAAIEERVFVEGPDREIVPDASLQLKRPHGRMTAVATATTATPEVVRIPELEIHESYVSILDRQNGHAVVSIVELVSPTYKYAGPGRVLYREKQTETRASKTHLIEIDLLRAGPHVLAVPEWAARGRGEYDYLICVNRAKGRRDEFELYRQNLRQPLPQIRIPLAGNDPDVLFDLQSIIARVYEAGSYQDELAYDAPCVPPLAPEDQAWADQLIQQARQAGSQENG